MEWLLTLLAALHHELLLFAVIGLAIGGLDDLAIDMVYLGRLGWRHAIIYSRHDRMTTATLPPSSQPGRIAIFVPAWQEADVIGAMLRHAIASWREADYRIFVGVYPNDVATIAAVASVAEDQARLVMAVNDQPGPSTKADCLNTVWRAMLGEEQRTGVPFKAIVLHDCEDVVHPDEIALYDYMIDRFDLVQLPVLPLPGQGGWWSRMIADHYCDEFAESHGKSLIVREYLGASVPSAGVACAFSRSALDRLVDSTRGGPFDPGSLTEDYEAGLRVRDEGGRGVFVRMRDRHGDLVATREFFPDSFGAAVRQKARWMIGISLAGWDRLGWRGGPAEWWMRIRDRRSALAALVLCAAYLTLLLWLTLRILGQNLPPPSPLLRWLIGMNASLLAWRMVMRAAFSWRHYSWQHGLTAVPRMVIANIIAIAAARRAMDLYIRSLLGKPLVWDKTQHRFPDMAPGP